MKIYVSHSNSSDYEKGLYLPLRNSSIGESHEIFLPHEGKNKENTKEAIEDSDLLIAETSEPSTGSGIEIGWANASGVPILALHKRGVKTSNSLRYVAEEILEYEDSNDMIAKIEDFIARM